MPDCPTENTNSSLEDFLSEIEILRRVFEGKGIKVGTLLKKIMENIQILNLENSLSNLFEVSSNKEEYLTGNYFENLLKALVQFRIIDPEFEVDEINSQKQSYDFRKWQKEHKNYLYSLFGTMLAKYIALEENPSARFLLPTVRNFLSTFKSYILPISREGLDIKGSWKVLFGNGDAKRNEREDETSLFSHFEELLFKMMSR